MNYGRCAACNRRIRSGYDQCYEHSRYVCSTCRISSLAAKISEIADLVSDRINLDKDITGSDCWCKPDLPCWPCLIRVELINHYGMPEHLDVLGILTRINDSEEWPDNASHYGKEWLIHAGYVEIQSGKPVLTDRGVDEMRYLDENHGEDDDDGDDAEGDPQNAPLPLPYPPDGPPF